MAVTIAEGVVPESPAQRHAISRSTIQAAGNTEVIAMEFSIWCPTDGTVEVGLDDIDSIVVRSGSDVEVTFVCPRCGDLIALAAQVPHSLLATLDDAWVRIDEGEPRMVTLRRSRGGPVREVVPSAARDGRVDSYCEYFRRELAVVVTVDDVLAEIDAREVR
jgi:hypothetical protein